MAKGMAEVKRARFRSKEVRVYENQGVPLGRNDCPPASGLFTKKIATLI